jgi:hypothetical protein
MAAVGIPKHTLFFDGVGQPLNRNLVSITYDFNTAREKARPTKSFYTNDVVNSWLVKVGSDDSVTKVTYGSLLSQASIRGERVPRGTDKCSRQISSYLFAALASAAMRQPNTLRRQHELRREGSAQSVTSLNERAFSYEDIR